MSKIEQIIEDMQGYFRECKSPAFSSGKIICEKSVIDEFIDDLTLSTPDEIKKYQKIISQKDVILGDAKSQAAAMLTEADKKIKQLLDEHEIMKRAYEEAKKLIETAREDAQVIVNTATEDGNNIRRSAIEYTDKLLAQLQNTVDGAISVQNERHAHLINNLTDIAEVVANNRRELQPVEIKENVIEEAKENDNIEASDIFINEENKGE